MKVTKIYFLGIVFIILLSCTEDKTIVFNTDNSFVRFFLLVDNNNEALEFPQVNGGLQPVNSFTKNNFKILKIPVALASLNKNVITVDFKTTILNLNNIEITPQNKLTFTKDKKVDTIYVKFNERWNISKNPKLEFELTKSSDKSISIGMPNDVISNNKLTINFSKLNFTYKIANPNNQEIIGNIGEKRIINIDFPKGFIASEIANTKLLLETQSNFDYSLEQLPITKNNQISYVFTVNEHIKINVLEFKTKFELNNIANYKINGLKTVTIKKELVVDRDNTTFTAAQFYNLSDQFHRTYGEYWFDLNANGVCDWSTFNAFTFPVIVESNHPNAVLFDDKGTANPTDDIYHHAFRIGFNTPIAGRTTNSFNLKRWFTNESTNSANSPGFNITEALEFFPLNGNSKTEGFVKVVENDLQIQDRNGNNYTISISGNGTYKEISTGLIEINFELKAENTALFGGTRTAIYKLYNQRNYPKPAPINQNCNKPIEL
ncbi:hypothetical protein [Polaribacter cellanae]|uniref:Uncharacterized protein n=1 Tax=Polaribacter cellanae TaxID=2818493 RepID=A0A975CQM9_9FLAO|nr:hypothetical protein [Polaribacter cellanae]QTE21431.1 hypothetical protein J3359_11410 [Polaribacter cellanae]